VYKQFAIIFSSIIEHLDGDMKSIYKMYRQFLLIRAEDAKEAKAVVKII